MKFKLEMLILRAFYWIKFNFTRNFKLYLFYKYNL